MTIEEIKKVYVTSDFHFSHFNIIGYTGRPWKTCEEMDEAIIKNMIESVPNGSILINLGDVSMIRFTSMKRMRKIRKLVLAHKGNRELWLRTGNHDKGMESALRMKFHKNKFKTVEDAWKWIGFDKIFTEDIALPFNDKLVVMSHYPIVINDDCCNIFNIHGHTHEKPAACMNAKNKKQYKNVCIDWAKNNYKAIKLTKILGDFNIAWKKVSSHDKTNEKRPSANDKSR